jgi:hypothetical protein
MFKTKSSLILSLLVSAVLMLPLMAQAAERIEGKMNGLQCAITGYVCTIDERDPMIALESDFVVQQPDGEYYIIPNIDRALKAKYFLEEVAVVGDVNERYKSVTADEFLVKQPDGTYLQVWSVEREQQQREQLYGPSPSH